ncbi:ATP-dependent RNA helicase dbp7 [Chytridiales sp. JEL 0842]|nr:ATP-dependent RNA helicase dbp7 [Chytridiales sp. JEL 0842]
MGEADDGLMLNFAAPDGAASGPMLSTHSLTASSNVKGSWKKKRITAKITKYRIEKGNGLAIPRKKPASASSSSAPSPSSSQKPSHSNKPFEPRNKTGSGGQRGGAPPRNERAGGSSNGRTNSTGKGKDSRQQHPTTSKSKTGFISSLFSKNSESPMPVPAAESAKPEDTATVKRKPTNAVPQKSATTFEGLGLHPILCSHLTTKLSVHLPTSIQRSSLRALIGPDQASTAHNDAFIQAQTGSGKTLAYLLPILQKLLDAEDSFSAAKEDNNVFLQRSAGTLAIVLAPTRELAKQIQTVLESVLKYNSSGASLDTSKSNETTDSAVPSDIPSKTVDDVDASKPIGRRRHWIVPGLVVGGDKRKAEKARLRKGCTILVSTPGRLLDHLKTTQSFETGNLRWLVLDEADRLLELGFENTLNEIIKILDDKRAAAVESQKRVKVTEWPSTRQILLTSATIEGGVRKLAENRLKEPIFIYAKGYKVGGVLPGGENKDQSAKTDKLGGNVAAKSEGDSGVDSGAESDDSDDFFDNLRNSEPKGDAMDMDESSTTFQIPAQLEQRYLLVPAKLRLITLVGVLRQRALQMKQGLKVILFADTCDSVDFLYHILGNGHKAPHRDDPAFLKTSSNNDDGDARDISDDDSKRQKSTVGSDALKPLKDSVSDPNVISLRTNFIPSLTFHRLHGNLPQPTRAASYSAFIQSPRAVLICTDVAARGLDLPDVTDVIQYDPPADVKDYVHRIGRTARLGRDGKGVVFLLPSEEKYVSFLNDRGVVVTPGDGNEVLKSLVGVEVEAGVEEKVAGGDKKKPKKKTMETAATDIQMAYERFVLGHPENLDLARNAFRSHVRAYATHIAAERHIFHIKNLHLGHIAKSFALREAPAVGGAGMANMRVRKDEKTGLRAGTGNKNLGPQPFNLKRSAGRISNSSEFADGGVSKFVPRKKQKSKK